MYRRMSIDCNAIVSIATLGNGVTGGNWHYRLRIRIRESPSDNTRNIRWRPMALRHTLRTMRVH